MNSFFPTIIQGGMGAGVSHWRLASAVSRTGQLGVVSGVALDQILARRLQQGDPNGHMRRAISHFPDQATAQRVLERYFVPGGRASDDPFRSPPMFRADSPPDHLALNVLANFVEVWLAREDHDGIVGINLLEKITFPTLTSLYGAMLAGVDYVLMGAGIPWQIPGILDQFARGEGATMKVPVEGGDGSSIEVAFDPASLFPFAPMELKRPRFLAIVSSAVLAQSLKKRSTGSIDGFVVEHWVAGGHNAPPRGAMQLSDSGEPLYGDRDVVDFSKFTALGVPFWLAGGAAWPGKLAEALELGAAGIQVGTAFAFCEESGLDPELRARVREQIAAGTASIFTDPAASPTGFPFKVVNMPETASEPEVYAARDRVCDLGFLRRAYRKEDGTIGYRCPSEPEEEFARKGGAPEETAGRKCLCNGLLANLGMAQVRPKSGYVEPPLLTAGDDLPALARFFRPGTTSYHASDVIDYLLAGTTASR